MILYTTLTIAGVEKSLADWQLIFEDLDQENAGKDRLVLSMPAAIDTANPLFAYGTNVIYKINRIASRTNPSNSTLPASVTDGGGALTFIGGAQKFWGYCLADADRRGNQNSERLMFNFAGPYEFFMGRLVFQKPQVTYNGSEQVTDWQSEIVLGLSLNVLTGIGDTIPGTTATNLMSIAQQVKEIAMYAQADSAYQQQTNGLNWPDSAVGGQPAHAQFQCDQLTQGIDGVNYDLLENASANTLIDDYAGTALSGKTSASTLPAGSYMLRAPLESVSGITCEEAMRRQLSWLGGIGSPVLWVDHSQTPPQLKICPYNLLPVANVPLVGQDVSVKIKKRTDLVPIAIHYKYKVSGTYLGQPYNTVINDVAAYIDNVLVEGVGQIGALTDLTGTALSSGVQDQLMAMAKTATAQVKTFNLAGANTSALSAAIKTQALNMVNPAASGADGGFWATLFPDLKNFTAASLQFYNSGSPGVTITDPLNPSTVYYSGGSWTGTSYPNILRGGQLTPWMTTDGTTPGVGINARITAYFSGTPITQGAGGNTATSSVKGYDERHIDVVLTNMSTGTYTSTPSSSGGEPVPYGLAGYILALESIPQYEGTITIQETEISDVCPIGKALGITNNGAAWNP